MVAGKAFAEPQGGPLLCHITYTTVFSQVPQASFTSRLHQEKRTVLLTCLRDGELAAHHDGDFYGAHGLVAGVRQRVKLR